MEIDHTDPHERHGPPGHTGRTEPGNGGPTTRLHHRIKTHGAMSVRQPRPGLDVWRTPHRRYLAVDHRGTRRVSQSLGDALFSSTSRVERKFAAILVAA